jgi:hypothetical protein
MSQVIIVVVSLGIFSSAQAESISYKDWRVAEQEDIDVALAFTKATNFPEMLAFTLSYEFKLFCVPKASL